MKQKTKPIPFATFGSNNNSTTPTKIKKLTSRSFNEKEVSTIHKHIS